MATGRLESSIPINPIIRDRGYIDFLEQMELMLQNFGRKMGLPDSVSVEVKPRSWADMDPVNYDTSITLPYYEPEKILSETQFQHMVDRARGSTLQE